LRKQSETTPLVAFLKEHGLLLQQDKTLPSVVAIVAGETLSGSWWKHPRAHAIFRCLGELAAHKDVLMSKLVAGKVTFVHRQLWPAILAVAMSREPWQLDGLSDKGRRLLAEVEDKGQWLASGPPAKELERRLLVHGEQEHTEAGHHETRLETWKSWSLRVGCRSKFSAEEGREELEAAILTIGGDGSELPWKRPRLRRR
jgi:hypothetical protein